MSREEKSNAIAQARGLSKWFKVELTISIFGHTILHWIYPPQASED